VKRPLKQLGRIDTWFDLLQGLHVGFDPKCGHNRLAGLARNAVGVDERGCEGVEVVADNIPAEVVCSNTRPQAGVCREDTEVLMLLRHGGKDDDDGDDEVTSLAVAHPWVPVDCRTW